MSWKRTFIISSFLVLAGFLAWIKCEKIEAVLAAVGSPLATYIAVKGKGGRD